MIRSRANGALQVLLFAVLCSGENGLAESNSFRARVVSENRIELDSTADCSPGTIIEFGQGAKSTFLVINQRLSEHRYQAEYIQKTDHERIQEGMVGLTNTLLHAANSSAASPIEYWLALKNHFLLGSSEWLVLENGKDLVSGKLPKHMPFLLSARQPQVSGYLSLFSPEQDGRVVVFYPNQRPGSISETMIDRDTSENNLTYDARQAGRPTKAAVLNVGLRAEDPGPTHFVVLISSEPRPLSDFLPASPMGHYVDWQGLPIEPWEIGPGFLKRGAPKRLGQGIDYLSGESWAVSTLSVVVAQ